MLLKGQMTHNLFFVEKLKFGRFRCQLETLKILFDLTFYLRENRVLNQEIEVFPKTFPTSGNMGTSP